MQAKQNLKQQKNPKPQHTSSHTILLLEALISLLQQSALSNQWLFLVRLCLALRIVPQCFQACREHVSPHKGKFLSQKNLNKYPTWKKKIILTYYARKQEHS